jgi:hypothetical protein
MRPAAFSHSPFQLGMRRVDCGPLQMCFKAGLSILSTPIRVWRIVLELIIKTANLHVHKPVCLVTANSWQLLVFDNFVSTKISSRFRALSDPPVKCCPPQTKLANRRHTLHSKTEGANWVLFLKNTSERKSVLWNYSSIQHYKESPALLWQGWGTRCSVVGSGTKLQEGRSRVPLPMKSLNFSIDLIFQAALWPWGRLSL